MMRMYDIISQKMSFDGYILKNYEITIEKVKSLYYYETAEVIYLLRQLGEMKNKFPVGVEVEMMMNILCSQRDKRFFGNPKYTISLINQLSTLGLVELRINRTIDITPLGLEFIFRSERR